MDKSSRALQGYWLLLADPRVWGEGIPVEEAAHVLGVRPRQVGRFIARLGQVGDVTRPGAYVDLALEGRRIKVYSPPRPALAPLRLSTEEVVALDAALTAVLEGEVDARLRETLRRLRRRLLALSAAEPSDDGLPEGESAGGAGAERAKPLAVWPSDRGVSAHFAVLREGLEARRRVALRYFSERSQTLKSYRIGPCLLVQYLGAWLVIDERGYRFRLDRIREATLTDEPFERPPDEVLAYDPGQGIFHGEPEAEVVLRRADTGARWRWRTASLPSVEAKVRCQRGAVVLEAPEAVRSDFVRRLRALRARYAE